MRFNTLVLAAVLTTATTAQTTVTVTTGAANATQTYYSLQNGEVAAAPLADWDLAFEITGFTSSIRVNTAKGLSVWETNAVVADWASVNTFDESNWTVIHNADTSWSVGALNHGNNLSEPGGVNVGWGIYNMITHAIVGAKVYVIDLGGATYKKLRINSLLSGTYSFTYANLDGSDEVTTSLTKSAFTGKNFGYFSFTTGATLDPEPASASWDLLFTKYVGFVPTAYPVAGVLQNKNVTALQVDGVPTNNAQWWGEEFSSEINIIGSDWKTFNMTTFQYDYAQDRTYFVQDRAGNIWKLVFIEYGGSSNGNMTFTRELMSGVGMEEVVTSTFAVFPNPVAQGTTRVVLDAPAAGVSLTVTDMKGRLVMQDNFNGNGGLTDRVLDVSSLRPGMYVAKLWGAGLNATARFVVE
jgi:hypothetical protein